MCLTLRMPTVPKKTMAYDTQTTAISRSMGHSNSAYSLPWVIPKGKVTTAATMTMFQPMKVNMAKAGANSRVWQVRCTM